MEYARKLAAAALAATLTLTSPGLSCYGAATEVGYNAPVGRSVTSRRGLAGSTIAGNQTQRILGSIGTQSLGRLNSTTPNGAPRVVNPAAASGIVATNEANATEARVAEKEAETSIVRTGEKNLQRIEGDPAVEGAIDAPAQPAVEGSVSGKVLFDKNAKLPVAPQVTVLALPGTPSPAQVGVPLNPSGGLRSESAPRRGVPYPSKASPARIVRKGMTTTKTLVAIAFTGLILILGAWGWNIYSGKTSPPQQIAAQEAWHKDLVSEWKSQLEQFESTKPHARFVREHNVQFRFLDSPGGKGQAQWAAAYVNKKVYINKTLFETYKDQLAKEGVPEKDQIRVLASKYLNFVGHEIRHGITQEELRALTGLEYHLPSVEEEYLSIMDEVRIFREVEEKTGLTTERGRLLLLSWRLDSKGVLDFTQRTYGGKIASFRADSDQKLIGFVKEDIDLAGKLDKVREFKSRFGNVEEDPEVKALPEAQRRQVLAEVEKTRRDYALIEDRLRDGMIPPEFREEDIARILAALKDTLLLLQSREQMGRIRGFYQARMAAIAEEWSSPRWRDLRKLGKSASSTQAQESMWEAPPKEKRTFEDYQKAVAKLKAWKEKGVSIRVVWNDHAFGPRTHEGKIKEFYAEDYNLAGAIFKFGDWFPPVFLEDVVSIEPRP